MRILNETLLSAATVATDQTSIPLLTAYAYGYAVQATFTGTPAGTLVLQGSADPASNAQFTATAPTNWSTISATSTAISAAGVVLINAQGVYYNWVRAVFTADGSPGTGTITVIGNTKGT